MAKGNERAKLAYIMFLLQSKNVYGSCGDEQSQTQQPLQEVQEKMVQWLGRAFVKDCHIMEQIFDKENCHPRLKGDVELTKQGSKVKVFKMKTS